MFRMHLLPVFAVLVAVCSASAREQNIVAINIVQGMRTIRGLAVRMLGVRVRAGL